MLDNCSIHWGWLLLDSCSTASRSVEIFLHALFFTCFASFYYLVIHSILFLYIYAFIWIRCTPLIILDHLYVSQVKLSSFLYPLSIMTKKGEKLWRKCGFFLRFYMLGEDVFHLVRGSACFILLVHQSCDHVYIHCAYLWYIYIYMMYVLLHLPLHVLFLFYLYTHASYIIVCNILFLFHTKMSWWVLFNVFQKYRLLKFSCHELSSCKVFQEFVLGYILLYSTSEYELSDLWLLSYVHLFVVILSRIAKGGTC